MRQRLLLLVYFACFWIVLQVVLRGLFLAYNHDMAAQLTANEIALVFFHGLKMDMSMSGYFIMFTSLLLTINVFTQSKWLYFVLNAVSVLGILLSCIIMMVDLELYRHWGFRLDTTPFFYITGAESEALGSVEISVAIKLLLLLAAITTIALFVYTVWLTHKWKKLTPTSKKIALPLLLITGLWFIPIRGSFTVAPMNTGFVYFHPTKTFANHAAINVVWNFMKSLTKSSQIQYPKDFFDNAKAETYFNELYESDDSVIHVFENEKPNVILFILESFTAGVIEPLGGVPGLTPTLNALCNEGIVFNNFYSSGDRTDKGVISILSGYPAQPLTSIIKFPSKTQKLPYLNHAMRDLGYRTSFVYGGDIDFANFRSYLTQSRFHHITTHEDFPEEDESKWGVHDHIVFERAFTELDTATAPFFQVILSLSSHEPFDVPMEPYIKGQDPESLFLNSCHYTDKSIGNFILKAKRSSWWDNTVIIFVADHGHRYPGNKELQQAERFRIPLIMMGGAIKKDTLIQTIGNQTDLANTLLAQISKPDPAFRFSRNLLSPNAKSFAAFFFNNGYGYVAPGASISFDNSSKQFINQSGASAQDLERSQAYQQILYLDYNTK